MSKCPSQQNNLCLAFIYQYLESNCLLVKTCFSMLRVVYVLHVTRQAIQSLQKPGECMTASSGWMYHRMKHCQLSATGFMVVVWLQLLSGTHRDISKHIQWQMLDPRGQLSNFIGFNSCCYFVFFFHI